MIGNLVVDKPAAQRIIMHSIPKSQIVPDPKSTEKSIGGGNGKRVVEEISSDESSEEGEVRPSKKAKVKKCKCLFLKKFEVTKAKKNKMKKEKLLEKSLVQETEVVDRLTPPLARFDDSESAVEVGAKSKSKKNSNEETNSVTE